MFKELYQLRKEFYENNYFYFPDNNDPFYTNDYNDNDNDNDNDNVKCEENDQNKIPPFFDSMRILDKYIQQIEKSIQFIKGKYKYSLINILFKLKLQYREDTIRLLEYWRNGFM
jgi:hypothetical protein